MESSVIAPIMSDELFESTLLELNSRLEESQSSMQDLKDELESLREEKRLEKGTEMEMMRASLEELSQELGREKMKRAEEEEKVSSLREIAEESRKALMR